MIVVEILLVAATSNFQLCKYIIIYFEIKIQKFLAYH